jgi:hypothetical protein
LDGRQEAARIGGERQCPIGTFAALLGEGSETGAPRRNNSKFGKRKQPIEGYEDQHNGNFEHDPEAGSLAPGPLLSLSWVSP